MTTTNSFPRHGEAVEEPAARPSPEQLIGTELDHFVVEEILDYGGMAVVYVGHDLALDRPVALKVISDESRGNPANEQRFLREARVQANLRHPNVVPIYYIGRCPPATGQVSGSLFFAMDLVEGGSLEDVLRAGETLDPETARTYLMQVARGLRAGQQAGIVHRDVKPANILLGRDRHAMIADYGLAKPVQDSPSDPKLTGERSVMGSPSYMAPEQARGWAIDHRADMYALGATFFQLLTGRPPYLGETSMDVLLEHLNAPIPKLRAHAPDVPPRLAAIIQRLLAKDPEDRYQDYDQLLEALEAAAPEETHFAGFWVRVAAVMIDSTLAATLVGLLGWPGLLVHLTHVTIGHAYAGQTLAKYILRLRVCMTKGGGPIGLWRSLLRTATSLWLPLVATCVVLFTGNTADLRDLIEQARPGRVAELERMYTMVAATSGLFLTVVYAAGLAMAAFERHKRAAHDLIVGSVVVYQLAAPPGRTIV